MGVCSCGGLFLYLDSGGIQPSMGHMTRLLLKPSEYRELSWKAKENPCSSLLMMCTVSLASLPVGETPALSEGLTPAPEAFSRSCSSSKRKPSQKKLFNFFSLFSQAPQLDYLPSFLLLYKGPVSPGEIHLSPSRTLFHQFPAPAGWPLCFGRSCPR